MRSENDVRDLIVAVVDEERKINAERAMCDEAMRFARGLRPTHFIAEIGRVANRNIVVSNIGSMHWKAYIISMVICTNNKGTVDVPVLNTDYPRRLRE